MAFVVKLAILGHQCFEHMPIAHPLSVLRHKGRVVFPHAPILAPLLGIHIHIAPNGRNALRGVFDHLVVRKAIVHKSRIFPFVAQQIPRHGHFGKHNQRAALCPRLFNFDDHLLDVHIGMPGHHPHLRYSYLHILKVIVKF